MRKPLAMFLVLFAFATSACSGSADDVPRHVELKDNLTPITTRLNDGQLVECVVFKEGYGGGVSCLPSKRPADLEKYLEERSKDSERHKKNLEEVIETVEKFQEELEENNARN